MCGSAARSTSAPVVYSQRENLEQVEAVGEGGGAGGKGEGRGCECGVWNVTTLTMQRAHMDLSPPAMWTMHTMCHSVCIFG